MTFPPSGPPQYPHSPYGAAPVGPPADHRNRTLLLTAIVAILALLLTTGVVLFWKARNGDINIPGITLQSADEAGNDPFTPSVALSNKPVNDNIKLASNSGAQDNGVRVVSGTQPGLYASDEGTCDAAALGNYLANNPSAGAAWASVFGIDRASIPYYLNTLTPVILTADTWVTNHSYQDGSAYAFQSVLQAGTAVMVDGAGVPRVRCGCGNPLAPPVAAPIGGYHIHGTHWHDYHTHHITRVAYSTQNVTVVNNTTTIIQQAAPAPVANQATLSLVPINGGQLIERVVGNILDLSGQAPLAEELPNPVSANSAYVATTDEDAERQGLARAGSAEVAEDVIVAAQENNGVPEGAPESESAAAQSAAQSAGNDVAAAPSAGQEGRVAASESTVGGTSASSSSSAAPTPTSFSGAGDSIGSFTFDKDGTATSCTAPSLESLTGSVALSCSDSVSRSISQSSLSQSSVSSATGSDGVWTISLTDGSYPVTSASWQTLTPATTTTTTTPEVETPTETVPETTVETTEPETAEVPTVETPTETEEIVPSS